MIISLDQIRQELTGKRSDQSKNGQVLQRAKEQLREGLPTIAGVELTIGDHRGRHRGPRRGGFLRVAVHGEEALVVGFVHALAVDVDDDEIRVLLGDLARGDLAEAPEAAEDHVIAQVLDLVSPEFDLIQGQRLPA